MLLYVNATKVESGGRLWRMLINRLLFCLIIMQLLMCLTIALQLRYINCIAAAPPVFAVFGFKWYLNRRFGEKVSAGRQCSKSSFDPAFTVQMVHSLSSRDGRHPTASFERQEAGQALWSSIAACQANDTYGPQGYRASACSSLPRSSWCGITHAGRRQGRKSARQRRRPHFRGHRISGSRALKRRVLASKGRGRLGDGIHGIFGCAGICHFAFANQLAPEGLLRQSKAAIPCTRAWWLSCADAREREHVQPANGSKARIDGLSRELAGLRCTLLSKCSLSSFSRSFCSDILRRLDAGHDGFSFKC
jgi:hypothetical protein